VEAGERRERQANQLELVSRWADDLAHEIKNPLHAMVINLELVKRRAGGEDPESLIERAEVVEGELHRVHILVDSLLRLVRPWPETDTADVDAVFEDLLPVFEARTRIRKVEYHHRPGGDTVSMQPAALAQVLLNLVDNAIDALPEGGRLVTTCGADGDAVRIEVVDDGPGLPRDLEVGDTGPGSNRPGDRSGLGLVVVGRLVREAGGSTRAVVELPRSGSA
jgi:signal transduction histidine kinase